MASPRNTAREPRTPSPHPVATPVPAVVEEDGVVEPAAPECAFPHEMRNGRCPVAVFNSPRSPRERISHSAKVGSRPLAFERGLLAVFDVGDAEIVRRSNPGGSTYIEADPKLAHDPLICSNCSVKTRWYSTRAYEQHTAFAHVG